VQAYRVVCGLQNRAGAALEREQVHSCESLIGLPASCRIGIDRWTGR
jgi:hypothetical protein